MKKITSLLLTALLLATMLSVFSVPASAEEEHYETIKFDINNVNKSGGSDHFKFFTNGGASPIYGWVAGDDRHLFTIHAIENPMDAQDSQLQIKRVELHITDYISDFAKATISGGTKIIDEDADNGDYVRIDDIHDKKLTIGGVDYSPKPTSETIYFDEIRVYYEKAEPDYEDHEIIYHSFYTTSRSQNFILDIRYAKDTSSEAFWCVKAVTTAKAGTAVKADTVAKVYTENSKLQIKSIKMRRYRDGTFDEINNIHSQSFSIPVSSTEYSEIIVYYEPVGTGSTLSAGNILIIAIVAVVALGGVAALVIVKKKKKPALADGENKDEE